MTIYIPIPIFFLLITSLAMLVTSGSNNIARIMHSKEQHHSGMDIGQTKEQL